MGKEKRKRSKSPPSKNKKEKTKTAAVFGYSNDSNPFGDTNLTSRFVWKKKIEQELEKGRSAEEFTSKIEKKRISALASDLEKAKNRRAQREREKQIWEEEMARLERERNHTLQEDWEGKEAQFHLEQAKKRSEIRLKEGRVKPIDIIYKNLNLDQNYDIDVNVPYLIFSGLYLNELKELKEEIRVYLELDTSHAEFWQAMLTVCNSEIQSISATQHQKDLAREIEAKYLNNSSYAELEALEQDAKLAIEMGGAIDVEFWETTLSLTSIAKAKAKLREIHSSLLAKRNEIIQREKERKRNEEAEEEEEDDDDDSSATRKNKRHNNNNNNGDEDDHSGDEFEVNGREKRKKIKSGHTYYDHEGDEDGRNQKQRGSTEEDMLKYEVDKGMAENEELFAAEVDLVGQHNYSWNHLHRPRKPKYYNRVKTGYEWNKYNQTHYDHDNPPPKIVQGYKFNLFYPDLIDKTKAPTFKVEKADGDTTVIRFHAGPPYEDVAFSIVNREWELSHKKGFKCVFDKGILHLWFNFKRFRYRR